MRPARHVVAATAAPARLLGALLGLVVATASVAGSDAWAAPRKPAKEKPAAKAPARPDRPAPGAGGSRKHRPSKSAPSKPTRRGGGPAAPPRRVAPSREQKVSLEVVRERLGGGVEVAVVPMPSAPVAAITVVEGAGSAHDPPGRAGLAGLLAHLGAAASPERRARLITERGGETDVHVGPDHVVATYVLPPGELELVLWMEADRLAARPDEASLLRSLQALARRHAADPSARHGATLDGLAFQGWAPYGHAPDGTPEDLLAIRDDALSGAPIPRPPRPIALVVAGPVEPGAVFAAARRHLGAIAAGPRAAPGGELPEQINQRAATVVDARTRTAALLVGFAVAPAAVEADGAALELAAAVLGSGPRSRLARMLVDEGSASSVRAWLDRRRGPSTFRVEVRVAPGGDPVTVRDRVERALIELGKSAPRPDELQRARAWLALQESAALARPDLVATRVGRAVLGGAATPGEWDLTRWNGVTGDALARAAGVHLSPIRRNVVEVQPERPLEPVVAPPPASGGRTSTAPVPATRPPPAAGRGRRSGPKRGGT